MSSSCFKQSPLVPKVSLVMFKLILSPSRFHSPSHSSGNSHSVKEINIIHKIDSLMYYLSLMYSKFALTNFLLKRNLEEQDRAFNICLILTPFYSNLWIFFAPTILHPTLKSKSKFKCDWNQGYLNSQQTFESRKHCCFVSVETWKSKSHFA